MATVRDSTQFELCAERVARCGVVWGGGGVSRGREEGERKWDGVGDVGGVGV